MEQKNLKNELLRAQEEVKRIQVRLDRPRGVAAGQASPLIPALPPRVASLIRATGRRRSWRMRAARSACRLVERRTCAPSRC